MRDVQLNPYENEISPEVKGYLIENCKRFLDEISRSPLYEGHKMSKFMAIWNLSFMLERVMCWREWIKEMPSIKFQEDWQVTVIPPFAGALVRFLVKKGEREVSVYFDAYDVLGCMFSPYWEVYCMFRKHTYRYHKDDTQGLIKRIKWLLENDEETSEELDEEEDKKIDKELAAIKAARIDEKKSEQIEKSNNHS